MNEPVVSVICPVYNAERVLWKCLSSIIKQDFPDIEIILVNDGSTDGSLRVCQKYARKDPRIHNIDKLKLLFVGTYFYGNVERIRGFVTGVMPSVDADFYVVGNKMDKLKDEMYPLPNVHYIGRVTDEELDWYYRTSDILIAPIVEGGGMKTKVVEAIMYGCPVIGTKEAFEGFEEYLDFIGLCSDNISDYKQYISLFDEQRDLLYEKSLQARRVYEEHFTNERSVEILSSLYQKKN